MPFILATPIRIACAAGLAALAGGCADLQGNAYVDDPYYARPVMIYEQPAVIYTAPPPSWSAEAWREHQWHEERVRQRERERRQWEHQREHDQHARERQRAAEQRQHDRDRAQQQRARQQEQERQRAERDRHLQPHRNPPYTRPGDRPDILRGMR